MHVKGVYLPKQCQRQLAWSNTDATKHSGHWSKHKCGGAIHFAGLEALYLQRAVGLWWVTSQQHSAVLWWDNLNHASHELSLGRHVESVHVFDMMTSSNGNIFRVTGPWGIPRTKASDAELGWLSIQSWGWWLETQSRSLWRHCNGKLFPCERVIVELSDISRRKLMNKQSSCRCFDMPQRSCDVTVMCFLRQRQLKKLFGWIILSHTLLGALLLIHAGIKGKPY